MSFKYPTCKVDTKTETINLTPKVTPKNENFSELLSYTNKALQGTVKRRLQSSPLAIYQTFELPNLTLFRYRNLLHPPHTHHCQSFFSRTVPRGEENF